MAVSLNASSLVISYMCTYCIYYTICCSISVAVVSHHLLCYSTIPHGLRLNCQLKVTDWILTVAMYAIIAGTDSSPVWGGVPTSSMKGMLQCNVPLISAELIVSRYVTKSITTDAGHFSHVGLCQLHAKLFCMQLTKAYVAEMSCISCY